MDRKLLTYQLERIRAHIDRQYRLADAALADLEAGEPADGIEAALEEIAERAGKARAIADDTRETVFHTA